MRSIQSIIISVVLLMIFAIGINLFNRLTGVDTPPPAPPPIPVAPQTLEKIAHTEQPQPQGLAQEQAPQALTELSHSQVVCRSQVLRGMDETLLTFYKDGVTIAKQRIAKNGTVLMEGTIPDGLVKVIDEFNQTSGETSYLDGKKSGTERTYYEDGRLQSETFYRNGRTRKTTEYFHNGRVRFEQDLEDERPFPNNRETGVGKLYHPNGLLKYEWNVTFSTDPSFKRSYNTDGTLRAEFYFDKDGKLLPPPPSLGVLQP
jgi:hypothetical protein